MEKSLGEQLLWLSAMIFGAATMTAGHGWPANEGAPSANALARESTNDKISVRRTVIGFVAAVLAH